MGKNRRSRTVEVSPGLDGTTTWWALLPTADSAVAWSAVTTLAADYQQVDQSLSIDQARADAMVDLILHRVTVTAEVTLGIPVVTTGTEEAAGPGAGASGPVDWLHQDAPHPEVSTDHASGEPRDGGPVLDVADVEWVTDHDTGEVVMVADMIPASRALVGVVAVPPERVGDGAVVLAPSNTGVAISGCAIPGIGWVEADTVAGICSTFPLTIGRALLEKTTGTLLETTTAAYTPGRAIRRHVQTRDGTCRTWGCTHPVYRCDLDHTKPWPVGATASNNLAGLCRRHHQMKQRARWRYTMDRDGTITWVSPTGAKRVTHPDHTPWPPPHTEPEPDPRTAGTPAAECYPTAPPF